MFSRIYIYCYEKCTKGRKFRDAENGLDSCYYDLGQQKTSVESKAQASHAEEKHEVGLNQDLIFRVLQESKKHVDKSNIKRVAVVTQLLHQELGSSAVAGQAIEDAIQKLSHYANEESKQIPSVQASQITTQYHYKKTKLSSSAKYAIQEAFVEANQNRLPSPPLGFVYQFHHLLPEFTALENVGMPLLIRGTSPQLITEKSKHLLELVGLQDRMTHKIGQLSGGERQRVAIARALVTEPLCVLADEPTGNLDPRNADKVLQLFFDLQKSRQTSVVMVTHDMQIARQTQRILSLVDGQLVTV